jgi:hypothetical protein
VRALLEAQRLLFVTGGRHPLQAVDLVQHELTVWRAGLFRKPALAVIAASVLVFSERIELFYEGVLSGQGPRPILAGGQGECQTAICSNLA